LNSEGVSTPPCVSQSVIRKEREPRLPSLSLVLFIDKPGAVGSATQSTEALSWHVRKIPSQSLSGRLSSDTVAAARFFARGRKGKLDAAARDRDSARSCTRAVDVVMGPIEDEGLDDLLVPPAQTPA
jgi:hypothetical protein